MKIYLYILCLCVCLNTKAEYTSDLLGDLFDWLSSTGNFTEEECDEEEFENLKEGIQSQICPSFLVNQVLNKDKKTMIFEDVSADNSCGRIPVIDTSFQDGSSFENYLRGSFSETRHTPIAGCLSQSFPDEDSWFGGTNTLPKEKHNEFIAEYYLSQHRFKSGINQSLQDIAGIDLLIGGSLLNGISCDELKSVPSVSSECNSLKKCSASNNDNGEALKKSAVDTILAMKAIKAIDQEIEDLEKEEDKNKAKIKRAKRDQGKLSSYVSLVSRKDLSKRL